MKHYRGIRLFYMIIISSAYLQAASAELNKQAPGFELLDSNGKTHNLSDYEGKYVILEWINFGCPFVRKHYNSGNMQKLQSLYAQKDVIWLSICSSAPGKQGYIASNEKINSTLTELGHKASAYLIDSRGDVGRLYGAKTSPHMYIVNREGVLIYNGAIDNKASTDTDDIAAADNYVVNTMDKLLAGQTVEAFKTSPYGCSVKY